MKPRRRQTPDEVAFTDTYRELHKRHGLSWATNLSGAALGVSIGADTVYANEDTLSAPNKIDQTTT